MGVGDEDESETGAEVEAADDEPLLMVDMPSLLLYGVTMAVVAERALFAFT